MDATIEDNICRFEPEPDYRKVIEAAKAAGVHEMIVKMPEGYRTSWVRRDSASPPVNGSASRWRVRSMATPSSW